MDHRQDRRQDYGDERDDRVVVTGMGLVTPCGIGVKDTWDNLTAGRSGIGRITAFDASQFAVRIAGEVKNFDPLAYISKKHSRESGRFTQFSLAAALMAAKDAGLELTEEESDEAACVMGVGMGGLEGVERVNDVLHTDGPKRVSPYAIPTISLNMAAGQITMALGLRGPSFCVTSACASGAHAIGEAAELVRSGRASVAVAGGAEATITPSCIAGFQAMFALSRRNEQPEHASRPFDLGRDGFVAGEGAAVLVLERASRAVRRGARIYAEIRGYGCASDAFHPVQPAPDGRGAVGAMRRALRFAKLDSSEVDYINAHGTGTPQGDVHECKAVLDVFRNYAQEGKLWVSSTKSMTGHLLGASGAVEAAFTAMTCAEGVVPPTINVDEQDPACTVDVVPNHTRQRRVRHAISNSFGFGGTNVSLVLSRFD